MEQYLNEFGQPIGPPLPGGSSRLLPPRTALVHRFCRVEPLDPERHAADLFDANNEDAEGRNWTYLQEDQGPYRSFDLYRRWAETAASTDDPLWHAIHGFRNPCHCRAALRELASFPEFRQPSLRW